MAEETKVQPQETVTLAEKTVVELKALAYDFIAAGEIARQNLEIVNQEIAKRNQA
jgi:hypothetical protein